MLKRNVQDFWHRFVTVDEPWIHHYTPETKQQSKQWVAPGENTPKKAKTVSSAGKMMAAVFGMLKESSLLTICRRVKQSQGNIMQRF